MVVTAASKPSPANLSLAILKFITIIEFQDYNTQFLTPTPWLTQLLVLGKSRVNQKLR